MICGHGRRDTSPGDALHAIVQPGSQIGIRPRLRPSIFASSMSMQWTSDPSSAKPAAVTRPTYPVPMTPIGSLAFVLIGRITLASEGRAKPYFWPSRRSDAAMPSIWFLPSDWVSVLEIQ